jgi:hypothetical protein
VGQRDRCEGWSPVVSALHSPHCIFRSLSDRPSLLSPRLSIGLMHPCASVFPFRLARSTVITARSIHRHRSLATTEHSASLCPYSASPFVSSRFSCLLPRHPYAMTADRENYNTSSRAKRSLQRISRKRQGTRTPYSTRQTNQRHTRTTPQERTTYVRRTPAPPLDGERRNPAPPLDSERRVGNIND